MRAVVTGGAGFIGSHLIEALVARGDEVVCIERPDASKRWIADLPVTWEAIGLDDVVALSRVFGGADVVFHLAALTEASSEADFYKVNTEGTAHVLRAASEQDGSAPRVIFLSSLAATGPGRNGDALSPDSIPLPLSHYGNSKLLAEAVVHAYADRVPTTVVRFPSVYGPRERAVLKFFRLVSHGAAITVGAWDRELSLIYVRDAVRGLIAAATARAAVGRTYCLAHPETVTWRDFATVAGQVIGRRPVLVRLPTWVAHWIATGAELCAQLRRKAAILNRERVREMSQQRWVCDPTRAMVEIGFRPTYPIARGVAETAKWYRRMEWL